MEKKKKYIILVVSIIAFSFLVVRGFSYAKYATGSIWNYYLRSKGFYFNSEDLSTSGVTNVNNAWIGENIYFELNNGLNELVASEVDINYSVTCSITNNVKGTCKVNNLSNYSGTLSKYQVCKNNTGDNVDVSKYTKAECETNGYEYGYEVTNNELFFNLEGIDINTKDYDVRVTATSTSPYRRVLIGDYNLHFINTDNEALSVKVNNHSDYTNLVITNSYNSNKCAKISWSSNDISILSDYKGQVYTTDKDGYVNSISIIVPLKNSINYNFYNNGSIALSEKDFTISESNTCNE